MPIALLGQHANLYYRGFRPILFSTDLTGFTCTAVMEYLKLLNLLVPGTGLNQNDGGCAPFAVLSTEKQKVGPN